MAGTVTAYLLVALGGAIGSAARFGVARFIALVDDGAFPWATFAVNIAGSFLIGVAAATLGPDGRLAAVESMRAFLIAGVLGGFTTFSAFSLETLSLLRAGSWLTAAANVIVSVLVCLAAVWAGHVAGSALAR